MVGSVPGARNADDPDMSVMVSAVTTRALERQEAVRKPLRVPDSVKHTGVDRAKQIRLQQEDYTIKRMGQAAMSTGRVGKTWFFEKKNGIVYRVGRDMARGETTIQQAVTKNSRGGQEEKDNPDEGEVLPHGWERCENEDGLYFWQVKSGTIQRDPPSPNSVDCKDPPQRSTSTNSGTSNGVTEGAITSGTDTYR